MLELGVDFEFQGHGGLTLERLLKKWSHYSHKLVARQPVDMLLLTIGGNDLAKIGRTASLVRDDLKELLDRVNLMTREVCVMAVCERVPGLCKIREGQCDIKTFNHKVHKFNKLLGRLVRDQHKLWPVDVNDTERRWLYTSTISSALWPVISADGVHLDSNGQSQYNDELASQIELSLSRNEKRFGFDYRAAANNQ